MTGPKISSCAIRMSLRTPVKTVGSWKKPISPCRSPPSTSSAPSSRPMRHVALHALELLGRDDRAHLGGRVEARAELAVRCDFSRICVDEVIVDVLVDEHARRRLCTPVPTAPQTPNLAAAAAASRSASGKTMNGLLPPSSRPTRLTRARRGGLDRAPGRDRTGERDRIDLGARRRRRRRRPRPRPARR